MVFTVWKIIRIKKMYVPITNSIRTLRKADAMAAIDNFEHDALTSLYNLTYFQNKAREWILDAINSGKNVTVFYMNICGFRSYNRMYGFQAGNALLRRISNVLKIEFPDGLLARNMADQFIGAVAEEDVQERFEKIHESMHLLQHNTVLELLTGLYKINGPEELRNADCISEFLDNSYAAMKYIYDKSNVNTCWFDGALKKEAELKNYVTENIDRAIENGWIKTYYQPCIDIHTGKLFQYEALARWEDPEHGLLTPDKFIPYLENIYEVYKVDFAVLENTCREIHRLYKKGNVPVPISFNLSRTDFESCDVVGRIKEISDRYSVPRFLLHAEITESAMNGDTEIIKNAIEDLHKIGCEVWMDDFGSGFSSLNILKDYPFDVIKMDMVFLRHFDERSENIISAVTEMNKKLGFRTLVEGVETEEQMNSLSAIGCDIAQGYLFSKPLPYERIKTLKFDGLKD